MDNERKLAGAYIKNIEPFEAKVWLSSPTMHGDELKYVAEAYETNWMSTVGKNINEVERMTCEKTGCRYAVALSCGTAALHMAVKLAGVKRGDKVFCSDMTFDATVNPVVYEGGIPVFVDTEYDTWNMDPVALEKAFELYPEVKVVVVAHDVVLNDFITVYNTDLWTVEQVKAKLMELSYVRDELAKWESR